jgi:hypothetical protein
LPLVFSVSVFSFKHFDKVRVLVCMSSYRQIFKSTAVIGAAQVANIGIGVARIKVMALLLDFIE